MVLPHVTYTVLTPYLHRTYTVLTPYGNAPKNEVELN
jgi:hypothetical protein